MLKSINHKKEQWEKEITHKYLIGKGASQEALVIKEHACQCKRCKSWGFNPWVRTIPWGGHGNPLQYSCLENPMNSGAWWVAVHRVAQSQRWLKWLSMHVHLIGRSFCCCSVMKLCPTLWDTMNYSMPGLSVPHHLPEFAQVHVHWIDDVIQPSHPLSPSSPAAFV